MQHVFIVLDECKQLDAGLVHDTDAHYEIAHLCILKMA